MNIGYSLVISLPASHNTPVHPGLHPVVHSPVTVSHDIPPSHWPHIPLQFWPYVPLEQTESSQRLIEKGQMHITVYGSVKLWNA